MRRRSGTPALTVYSASWCGYCRRLLRQLDAMGVRYHRVDVDRSAVASAYVETLNNGDRIVPTVVFRDGRSLTNPSAAEVVEHLAVT